VSIRLETAAKSPTDWERTNIDRKRKRLEREPGNRTRTMQLIRALHRADELAEAKDLIDRWIAKNHMDPEALVQLAQWHSLRGEFDEALLQLANGVDAAPRGEWVQERAHRAYVATGDEARACAHGVALRALQSRPEFEEDDILACDLATDLSLWGRDASESPPRGSATPEAPTAAERKEAIEAEMKKLGMSQRASTPDRSMSGQLQVEADWEGTADLDLIVIEPDGRALSWLSQRRRIDVEDVRAPGTEAFALPSMRTNGTYRIVVVSSDASTSVSGTVRVKAWGKRKSFPFSMSVGEAAKRVAETERTVGWR